MQIRSSSLKKERRELIFADAATALKHLEAHYRRIFEAGLKGVLRQTKKALRKPGNILDTHTVYRPGPLSFGDLSIGVRLRRVKGTKAVQVGFLDVGASNTFLPQWRKSVGFVSPLAAVQVKTLVQVGEQDDGRFALDFAKISQVLQEVLHTRRLSAAQMLKGFSKEKGFSARISTDFGGLKLDVCEFPGGQKTLSAPWEERQTLLRWFKIDPIFCVAGPQECGFKVRLSSQDGFFSEALEPLVVNLGKKIQQGFQAMAAKP